MGSDHFTLTASDGTEVFVYQWCHDEAPSKGIVQIAHGMAEHAGRYAAFAHYLNESGYAVYANDHRGHGKTAGNLEKVGYFADSDGWQRVVEDMADLTKMIKQQLPNLPVFLLGHSMGSFLARHYAFLFGAEVKGIILSGTGGDPGLLGAVGRFVSAWEGRFRGKKARSQLMTNMSFGSFNKAFQPNRTDFDWLSRDPAAVDRYIDDPYCGDVFTTGFFYDLLSGLSEINKTENILKTPKELPIYLFAGAEDPVGDNGKGVLQIHDKYKKAGIQDLACKLYPGGRHEMLNETNKDEVYQDILNWLDSHL